MKEKIKAVLALTANLLSKVGTHGSGKILLISVVVGFIAALGAGIFHFAVEWCKSLFLVDWAGDPLSFVGEPRPYARYTLLIVPALGGLLSGLLVWLLAPEAKGHGTDNVIEAYHHKRGLIRPMVPFVKTIASAITIGTGGSAGKEGPIAQIAAGLASSLGRLLHLNYKEMRIITLTGLAAGIGAIFHAPLASGIFASEVLYREMEFDKDVLIPSLIASIISFGVYTSLFGHAPLFTTPHIAFTNVYELLPYTVVGLVCALGSRLFVRMFYKTEAFFEELKMPAWAKPALGGLGVGVVGLFLPQTLSESYAILQKALDGGGIALSMFFLIALGKMVTTSLTIGSGGSGGVFGPSMVIGGILGGGIGVLMGQFMDVNPSAFVIVGMAGFFSAAANTPISTIIMVSEITGSHALLVPTMWVATIAYFLGRGSTLYKKQLWNRFEAPSEMSEMMSEILERMTVGEACPPQQTLCFAYEHQPAFELDELDLVEQREFVVVDDKGQFKGVLDRASLRHAKLYQHGKALLVSNLLLKRKVLQSQDSLKVALRKMISAGVEQLFLLEDGKPVSFLRRQDIITAYDRRMQAMEATDDDEVEDASVEEQAGFRLASLHYDVVLEQSTELWSFFADLIGYKDQAAKEAIIASFGEREALGSTAMGRGVAFPHPKEREHARGHAEIHIVKLVKPIDFGALDGKPVGVFILLWCGDSHTHIEIMARLASLLANGSLLEVMEARNSLKEVSLLIEGDS